MIVIFDIPEPVDQWFYTPRLRNIIIQWWYERRPHRVGFVHSTGEMKAVTALGEDGP